MSNGLSKLLTAHGLNQHRWRRRVLRETVGRRLRAFCEEAGPEFVAFAHELGRRLDLLPLSECDELSSAQDRSEESSSNTVVRVVEQSLQQSLDRLFEVFEGTPIRRNLFSQWHRAVTVGGCEVMVQVVRPGTTDSIDHQMSRLWVLRRMRVDDGVWAGIDIPELLDGFRTKLEGLQDLERQRRSLRSLRASVVDRRGLEVAKPVDDLCGTKVLTIKGFDGVFIDRIEGIHTESKASDLARRLCFDWLQQALLGKAYPEAPGTDNIMMRDDERFVFIGGGTGTLDGAQRQSLLAYLRAARREDPDTAVLHLLSQMDESKNADSETLQQKFRQAEPFRDGGCAENDGRRRIAQLIFVHWRLAAKYGFRPNAPLRRFCSGLAELEATSRRLAPERDTMRDGIDDLRVVSAAVSLRELVDPSRMVDRVERFLPVAQDLFFDRSEPVPSSSVAAESGAGAGIGGLLGYLMVMMALALATPEISARVPWPRLVEISGVVGFLLVAAGLLWTAGRRADA